MDAIHLAAVCQMTSTPVKEENLKTCENLVRRAADMGAQVVFLPEACDYLVPDKQQAVSMAETMEGRTVSAYKLLAKTNRVWLSVGGVHIKDEEGETSMRSFNRHIIIDPEGTIQATYDKMHLFDMGLNGERAFYRESSYIRPGDAICPPTQTLVGKIGLGIPLLRARAIETQCYVVAAAQTGMPYSNRECYGHAMIIDPWGEVACCCHEGTDVSIANIDLHYLQKIRKQMPIWNHRRPEKYT